LRPSEISHFFEVFSASDTTGAKPSIIVRFNFGQPMFISQVTRPIQPTLLVQCSSPQRYSNGSVMCPCGTAASLSRTCL
jgi:hypothetical protein